MDQPSNPPPTPSPQNSNDDDEDDKEDVKRTPRDNGLAQAMSIIGHLETENDEYRREVIHLRQCLTQLTQEREEERNELQKQQRQGRGGSTRSSRSSSTSSSSSRSERAWQERLHKLETTNRNQKDLFQTALEIKEVELQIAHRERDILAQRLQEIKQARLQHKSSLKSSLPAIPRTVSLGDDPVDGTSSSPTAQPSPPRQHDTEQAMAQLERALAQTQQELAEMEERGRLETAMMRRVMDERVQEYESSLQAKDQAIQALLLAQQQQQAQQETAVAPTPLVASRPPPIQVSCSEGHKERLQQLRHRRSSVESLMRSNVERIRQRHSSLSVTMATAEEPTPTATVTPTSATGTAAEIVAI